MGKGAVALWQKYVLDWMPYLFSQFNLQLDAPGGLLRKEPLVSGHVQKLPGRWLDKSSVYHCCIKDQLQLLEVEVPPAVKYNQVPPLSISRRVLPPAEPVGKSNTYRSHLREERKHLYRQEKPLSAILCSPSSENMVSSSDMTDASSLHANLLQSHHSGLDHACSCHLWLPVISQRASSACAFGQKCIAWARWIRKITCSCLADPAAQSMLICSQTNWQRSGWQSVDYWPSLSSPLWQTQCDSCDFPTIKAILCLVSSLLFIWSNIAVLRGDYKILIVMLLLKISCLLIVSKPCFYFMEISRIITLMWHKGSNLCWRIKEGPILTGELQTWVTTHTGLNIFCLMCKTWCNDRLILYKDMQKPKQRQAQAADEGTPTLARTDAAWTHTITEEYIHTQTQWKKRMNIYKKKI